MNMSYESFRKSYLPPWRTEAFPGCADAWLACADWWEECGERGKALACRGEYERGYRPWYWLLASDGCPQEMLSAAGEEWREVPDSVKQFCRVEFDRRVVNMICECQHQPILSLALDEEVKFYKSLTVMTNLLSTVFRVRVKSTNKRYLSWFGRCEACGQVWYYIQLIL